MLWIEATLAFALTMTILSTITSVIIETGHRLGRSRERGLHQIAERLHQDVLAPLLPKSLHANSAQFAKSLTHSSFSASAPRLTALQEKEFVRKLANSREGHMLYEQHGQDRATLTTLLNHITERFDGIGREASDYFKRRASLYSLLIGLLLAFSLNINTPHLFQTFLASKDARIELSEQAKELADWMENHTSGDELSELKPILKNLQNNALPFGWQTAPWNQADWSSRNHPFALLQWLLSLLLSGLLIGLGGPFWFDTYRKLGVLAGLHSGKIESVTQEKSLELKKQDWLALFEQSIKASQLGNR